MLMKHVSQAWRGLPAARRDQWKKEALELANFFGTQAHQKTAGGQTPGDQDGQTSVGQEAQDGQTSVGQEALDAEALVIKMGSYWVETHKDQLIGRGTYGSVYRGLHTETHQFVAVKVYHDQKEDETIKREIDTYEQMAKHDIHAPFAKMLWSNKNHLGMKAVVLELFDVDLHHWLAKNKPSESMLQAIGIQISLALYYLHFRAQMVHLDVKPSNIVWRGFDNKVALVDFGLVEPIAPSKPLRSSYCTANYRPPELWSHAHGGQTPGNLLQPAVDIWSFGCSWWQIVVGDMFFTVRAERKLEHVIEDFARSRRPNVADSLNPWSVRLAKAGRWGDLIQACMEPKPCSRPKNLRKYFQ